VWSTHDGGSHAFSSLSPTGASVIPAAAVFTFAAALLPVCLFAPSYELWHKEPVSSLVSFLPLFMKNSAALYALALAPLRLEGAECHSALRDAIVQVFATYGQSCHQAFLYGLFMGVWSATMNPRAAEIKLFMQVYMFTEDLYLPALLQQCLDPHAPASVSPGTAQMLDLEALKLSPGFRRLNVYSNPAGFSAAWSFLWDCVLGIVARTAKKVSVATCLAPLTFEVFERQGDDETVAAFFSRFTLAHAGVTAALAVAGKSDRLPHIDTYLEMIWKKINRRLLVAVKAMMRPGGSLSHVDLRYVTFQRTALANGLVTTSIQDILVEASRTLDHDLGDIDVALSAAPKPPKVTQTPTVPAVPPAVPADAAAAAAASCCCCRCRPCCPTAARCRRCLGQVRKRQERVSHDPS